MNEINKLHSWFNILLDHYNEEYFIDTEVDEFINAGGIEFVNDIIFKEYFPTLGENEKGVQALNSMESVIQGSEILQPLIIPDLTVSVTSGFLSNDDINTALSTYTSDANDRIMHVISLTHDVAGDERMIRFVRHNDRARFRQNFFKKPTERNPIFSIVRNGMIIEPSTVDSVSVSILKEPRKVSKKDGISLDLPSFTHQRVIAYAIALSGVASRDDALIQLQQISGNGTSRQVR